MRKFLSNGGGLSTNEALQKQVVPGHTQCGTLKMEATWNIAQPGDWDAGIALIAKKGNIISGGSEIHKLFQLPFNMQFYWLDP